MTGTDIHRHRTPRQGFTLVETLVSIGIFVTLVAIAVGGFVQAIHTQGEVSRLISAQDNVSVSIEEMAREIRTGFLFCHDTSNNTIAARCGGVNACTVNTDGSWTCPVLDYFTAGGDEVNYVNVNGVLTRTDNGSSTPLTSPDVKVRYLSFRMFGNQEGDHWLPRITVALDVSPSSSDPAIASTTFNFETTVSARSRDCDPTGGTCP
ncbi:MAG TPA: type II secretion system protein [Candidatus Paceibacterota bacterium]|nr:type II secretion system protein [Candidatus Paceibacterota bacterium]